MSWRSTATRGSSPCYELQADRAVRSRRGALPRLLATSPRAWTRRLWSSSPPGWRLASAQRSRRLSAAPRGNTGQSPVKRYSGSLMPCPGVGGFARWFSRRRVSRPPPPAAGGKWPMPAPADEPGQTFWGVVGITARNRSTVEHELALRPGCSAQARMPPTARPAPRGERRGPLVLTAGPVPYFYGRYPAGPVDVSPADWTRTVLAVFFCARTQQSVGKA
jgi:hypothetical protein